MTDRRWVPYGLVVLAVVAANLPAVAHLVTTDPMHIDSGLLTGFPQWLHGYPTADPNAGFLIQALGHLASTEWLTGHVPWWNPYEGVGVPLAGEMQSGAFYPFTLLLALPNGLLWLQMSLEVVAGCTTVALLGRLGVGRTLAGAGGVAFGLCGTFAWFAHGPVRVLALLPLCLLGVERVLDAAADERPWGWRILAVGLAGSVVAGFPETTVLDLAFVVVWAGLRTFSSDRLAAGGSRVRQRLMALRKFTAGGGLAVVLSAPVWVAFVGFLPSAYTGGHAGDGFAHVTLRARDLAQLILPYGVGPIAGFRTSGPVDNLGIFWSNVGGYLGVTLVAAGLIGLVGRRHRTLRIGLGLWIAVCLARTYGFAPVVDVLAHVPGLRSMAVYRYADPTWELAAVVLAALGLDDVARGWTRLRTAVVAVGVVAMGVVWAGTADWHALTGAIGPSGGMQAHRHVFAAGSVAAALGLLGCLLLGTCLAAPHAPEPSTADPGVRGRQHLRATVPAHLGDDGRLRRIGRVVMAAAVAGEAVLLVASTYASAPRPVAPSFTSVSWLQAHLGTYRFATLGPIQPNYGSYFRIAEVNVNDLPLPRAWTTYIAEHLDPNTVPFEFTGGYRSDPNGPAPAELVIDRMADYEAVGVRFVAVPATGADPTGAPFPGPHARPWPDGPRLVHTDAVAQIWELPRPAPPFSARTDGPASVPCEVIWSGWDHATVTCSRAGHLVRRVLYAPGWTADVGGTTVSVNHAPDDPTGLFQSVPVPAGRTVVLFTYLPPGERITVTMAMVGWIGLAVSGGATLLGADGSGRVRHGRVRHGRVRTRRRRMSTSDHEFERPTRTNSS